MTDAGEITLTDPARELAELCDNIRHANGQQVRGEEHLARNFGVEPWSLDFYEIVFTILKRIDLVGSLVSELALDSDFKKEVIDHLTQIGGAFSATSIRSPWQNHGTVHLAPANVQVLKAISGQIRQHVSYRKLSSEEVELLVGEVDELIKWLTDHQLSQQDFIRQALIEGLESLRFRLNRLQWLGWGYTLESLKEVISAYMVLERESMGPNVNPDAEAVLKKTAAVIQSVYAKIKATKETVETANWLVGAFGAASLIYSQTPGVKGLLN